MEKRYTGYVTSGKKIKVNYWITEGDDHREVSITFPDKELLFSKKNHGDLVYDTLNEHSMVSLLNRMIVLNDFYNMTFAEYPNIKIDNRLIINNLKK